MTTANEEFEDLMPHRIRVRGKTTVYDDFGRPVNTTPPREYRCLIDDSTTTTRDVNGTTVTVALTAYVAPVPIGGTEPVDIEPDETIEILSPRPQTRPMASIERHYDSVDGVGMLHNITLRFS